MRLIFSAWIVLFFTSAVLAQNNRKLIVKFKEGINYEVNYSLKKIIHPQLDLISSMNNLAGLSSMISKTVPADTRLKRLELIRDIHFLTLAENVIPDNEIARLLNTGLFEYVEKDHEGTGTGVNVITPNDAQFTNQWSLKNTGTFSATALNDADIDMDNAWDLTTGDANTIVCVLDAGFKLDHPELAGRIWQNPGEIAGNGIDDDANGYIDDTQGWDFANNDNNPTDDHGHGTNVASIIVAKGNNASGMAGINWNCKLMVGKILDGANSGLYSWWISGIYYAVSKGAKVINMSVGGASFSSPMQDACNFALANGVIIVSSMGNANSSLPSYPAAYTSLIAVGSTSDNDHRTVPFPWSVTSGSNYGSHIELVAPGNNILGAYNLNNTTYNYWSGTSQATPEVAGVVSLMLALKPDISFAQVMNVLATTSQDQVGNPLEDVPGWDQYYGFGRLNAFAALNAVISIIPLKFGEISAKRDGESNQVAWSTLSETDLSKFVIEYSSNRTNWQSIREVSSSGSSGNEKNYAINHFITNSDDAFYRIKAVNPDGSFIYSKIVRVNKKATASLFAITKIITGRTSINIFTTAEHALNCSFSLYSMDGRAIFKSMQMLPAGNGQYLWNVNLAPGRYQLIVRGENQKVSEGILVK